MRPGFSFYICQDSQLLRAHLAEQLAAHPPAAGGSTLMGLPAKAATPQWERHVYWGDEDPPPRFWEQLTLQGLFGASRVLLVRQAHLWPAAVWKKISHALSRPSEQCWPVFCLEMHWEKGQPKIPAHLAKLPCMAFADKQGWIWRHEGLTDRTLKRHVQQRAKALGLRFEADALEQFCVSVPPDAQAVENELAKLTLLEGEKDEHGNACLVSTSMIASSGWTPDYNVFACIRHMEAGNLAAVYKELARSREGDSPLFALLALLGRELRLLWQCQAGENPRMHPNEAAMKQQLARKLGPRGLAAGMAAVVDAEYQVKSGRRSPEQSLDFLVSQLTLLFGGQSQHAQSR